MLVHSYALTCSPNRKMFYSQWKDLYQHNTNPRSSLKIRKPTITQSRRNHRNNTRTETYLVQYSSTTSEQMNPLFTGDLKQIGPTVTQKPLYFIIFTNNIWPYFVGSPAIGASVFTPSTPWVACEGELLAVGRVVALCSSRTCFTRAQAHSACFLTWAQHVYQTAERAYSYSYQTRTYVLVLVRYTYTWYLVHTITGDHIKPDLR